MPVAFWAIVAAYGALMTGGALIDHNFPPRIFIAQASQAFMPTPEPHKHVFVTH